MGNARLKFDESHKKLCPDCGGREDPIRVDDKGIIWRCPNCKHEVSIQYPDPQRRLFEHKKAWSN